MASNPYLLHSQEQKDLNTEEEEGWDNWNAEDNELDDNQDSQFKCFFCELNFSLIDSLLLHCGSVHHFDFAHIKNNLNLDFYGYFKLVNYVRHMVAQNTCWSCGHLCKSNQGLLNHLHGTNNLKGVKHFWDDDKYLKPFMEGDPFLNSFDQDDDFEEDECVASVDEEELTRIIGDAQKACLDDDMMVDEAAPSSSASSSRRQEVASTSGGFPDIASSSVEATSNGVSSRLYLSDTKIKDKSQRLSCANVAVLEVKEVNESGFGSYSSFGIHREMLSDKVRDRCL